MLFFFFLVDIVCKIYAYSSRIPQNKEEIIQFAYFANPGIAFSIALPQKGIVVITGAVIIGLTLLYKKSTDQALRLGLASVILGSCSNFIDRIITQHTTDYIILFSQSALNVADLLILGGMAYCAWYYSRTDSSRT